MNAQEIQSILDHVTVLLLTNSRNLALPARIVQYVTQMISVRELIWCKHSVTYYTLHLR